MPDYASQIAAVIGSAPADLVAYYDAGVFPAYPASRINCLPFAKAREYSEALRGISVVDRLGLWVLDDANDSNPFGYISKGPCAGMIIHFSHDPEPEIAFANLGSFLAAVQSAGRCGIDIDKIAAEPTRIPLDGDLRELTSENTDDATFLLCAYLPVADGVSVATKESLAAHEDFFVREAFATFLARFPSSEDLAIAERLAADGHPQVARPGKSALSAVRAKIHNG